MSGLTSFPGAALRPDARLLVGVDVDGDGDARLYVGSRHTGIHTHLSGPSVPEVVAAWAGGATSHLWLTDVPDDALCDCPPEAVPDGG